MSLASYRSADLNAVFRPQRSSFVNKLHGFKYRELFSFVGL